ncbi:MAG: WbqC family protein [Rhodothermales bacterium]|nr:WbqC family protein [Rhodothermales bacterium]
MDSTLRVAIRPPEYFPTLDYFALMRAADIFVIADTFQYSRQSFHNRTRLRNPEGWQWLTIPLLGGQHGKPIRDIHIDRESGSWRRTHFRSFEFNYRSTAYFQYFENEILAVIETQSENLCRFTTESVRCIREILELPINVVLASDLDGEPQSFGEILLRLGAEEVVVLPDAPEHDRTAAGKAMVVDWTAPEYRQNFIGFEPGMSALDAIFNVGPSACRRLIGGP